MPFLGWRIFPDRSRLVRPNVVPFRRRMRAMQARYREGAMSWRKVEQRIQAWQAHAAQGDTWRLRGRLRECLLDEYSFTGGRRAI